MAQYIQPEFLLKAFTCMYCGVLTSCHWRKLYRDHGNSSIYSGFYQCECDHCRKQSLWQETTPADRSYEGIDTGILILPAELLCPQPHAELPLDCVSDFQEAREIFGSSPRGAAALLRLCLQKLCIHLGGKGSNINEDIGQLVKRGLAPQAQQALDLVRVTGNSAVHPGEISLEESPEHVIVMFEMINLIVEELIGRPRQIAEMFSNLPIGALAAIAKRDASKP
ncbi:DUF4145 domain-containing protein [Pseudomonas prosekii]|uniref:DUF4145 domain-containing protein n=1 Tax=Pseudomonas prosekii TaxID=1148509 RepID=UPI00387B374D